MRRLAIVAMLLAGCAGARPTPDGKVVAGPAWGALPAELAVHPDRLPAPGVLDFEPRQPAIFTLENGLTVYHLEDPTVPLVNVSLMVRGGRLEDPAELAGIASFTASAMRAGGAGERAADELDERIDFLGADVWAWSSEESSGAAMSALADDAPEVFGLLADVALRPRFEPARLDVLRMSMRNGIERRRDDPGGEAWRALRKAIHGPDSPFAREATLETLARLDDDAVRERHRRLFRPDGARLVISGAIDAEEARALASRHFGREAWPAAGDGAEPAFAPPAVERRVILIPRKIPQAKVRIGHLGFERHDPREYAIRLADNVLGGAMFVSRLPREIRSNRGLAYSISSSTSPGPAGGLFAVSADTSNEQAAELIESALGMIERMGTEPGVKPEELALAKDAFVNRFAFRFDTAHEAAIERATHDFFGYGADYLQRFPDRIAAVTPEAIDEAAKAIYDAGDAVIVVVGDPEKLGDLSRFGPVTVIEDVEAWK